MTARRDILRQIEEGLGSEGSPEIAEQMLDALQTAGAIGFDAQDGYSFVRFADDGEPDQVFDTAWDAALTAVSQ
jgi:hypothetical protein